MGSEVDSFRPVTKLSEVSETAIEANPVFGFKRDLVRLIGNMCWRHKKNQDTVSVRFMTLTIETISFPFCSYVYSLFYLLSNQVREIDGIPLLLDCSPIDANNPIMTQWVIFAIR